MAEIFYLLYKHNNTNAFAQRNISTTDLTRMKGL